MDALSEKLREIISSELQIDRDRVVADASLRGELGMDSIAALNILFAAQEEFGIEEIDEEEIAKAATVAEIESLVRCYVERSV